mgnify:FL=1
MALYTDQLGREVAIESAPQKIISIVPSQTELLYHLGLHDQVAGITKFCIHPQHWHQTKTRVGGTKNLQLETIKSLQPDLVIANKEENVQEQVEALAKDFPVWISDINNLPQALQMIHSIGDITGKETIATEIISNIQKGFETFLKPADAPTVVYLIWQEPYMTVGGDTFIGEMLELAGYTNLYKNSNRYPTITEDDIKTMQPDVLFLSSEPYPFAQKHVDTFQQMLPHTKVVLVDGEMFSWYGSRLQYAPTYFTSLQQQLKAD